MIACLIFHYVKYSEPYTLVLEPDGNVSFSRSICIVPVSPLVVDRVTCLPGTPFTLVQSQVGGYIVTRMIAIKVVPCNWHIKNLGNIDNRSS